MILTEINAYSRRDVTSKGYRKNFTINIFFKELFFLFDYSLACCQGYNDIQQWSDDKKDQKLNHENLPHIASILHKVKRFLSQVFQGLDHEFLFQDILSH